MRGFVFKGNSWFGVKVKFRRCFAPDGAKRKQIYEDSSNEQYLCLLVLVQNVNSRLSKLYD